MLDKVEMLERLTALWKAGTLSEDEFQREKLKLLSGLSTEASDEGQLYEAEAQAPTVAAEAASPKRIALFAGGALAFAIMLIAVVKPSSMSPPQEPSAVSESLASFGDYRQVEGSWRERTDTVDGPNKFLTYAVWSDDKRATLMLGCFDKSFTTAISMDGTGEMAFETKAVVGLRRDDEATDEPFLMLQGEKFLRPGNGTSSDARRFIGRLSGTNRLGFKIRSLMGIPNTDLPLSFDVRGANLVADNLERACRRSG